MGVAATASGERKCYVHVGTHKTGTTSIQWFLRNNRALLAAHGVLIPRSGRSKNDAGHHNLTQELLASPEFAPERGGLAEFVDELKGSVLPAACISCEDFSLLSGNPDALVRLRDAIVAGGYAPVIVVYLRPQISYLVSVYAEIVKNGNRTPFSVYAREIVEHGSFLWNGLPGPPFRYDLLLANFAAVFGAGAIVARRYRGGAPNSALLESIASIVSGKPIDAKLFAFPSVRTNPSSTFGGVLRQFGTDLGADDLRFAPLNLGQTVRLAARFVRSNLIVARCYGRWVPPCELRDVVLALPIRGSFRWTRALRLARRALAALTPSHDDLPRPNLDSVAPRKPTAMP